MKKLNSTRDCEKNHTEIACSIFFVDTSEAMFKYLTEYQYFMDNNFCPGRIGF